MCYTTCIIKELSQLSKSTFNSSKENIIGFTKGSNTYVNRVFIVYLYIYKPKILCTSGYFNKQTLNARYKFIKKIYI